MEAAAYKPSNRRSRSKSLKSRPGEKPVIGFHRRGFEEEEEEEKQQIPKRRRISKNMVLPEDIIHKEILTRVTRLPTKSILRLKVSMKEHSSLLCKT